MGKSNSPRGRKAARKNKARKAKPQGPGGEAKQGRKSLRRIRRALEQERFASAPALLDAHFGEGPGAARIAFLLAAWPARAELEWPRSEAALDAAIAKNLVPRILTLSGEAIRVIEHRAPAWAGDLMRLRGASTAVGEGRDDEARDELRQIGLRSPFRIVKLFLRGLSAYYQRQDEEAKRALSAVRTCPPYAQVAAALWEEAAPPTLPNSRRSAIRRSLNVAFDADSALLTQAAGAVRRRRPGQLLRIFASARRSMSMELREALMRDLPGALLSLGVEPLEALGRVERAMPEYARSPDWTAVAAIIAERDDAPLPAVELWTGYRRLVLAGKTTVPAALRRTAAAALHARVGTLCRELLASIRDLGYLSQFAAGTELAGVAHSPGDLLNYAREQLEQAVAEDPAHEPYWAELIRINEARKDGGAIARAVEAMVKALPDHPRVIERGARAALSRRAFDKALRHVTRATELEPLNRSLRDLRGEILFAKAVKKAHAGDQDLARRLCHEMCSTKHRTLRSQFEQHALAAALLEQLGDPDDAAEHRATALALEDYPWLWLGLLLMGQGRVERGGRKRLAPTITPSHPTAGPSAAELRALLGRVEASTLHQDGLSPALADLLAHATRLGGMMLTDAGDLALGLSALPAPIDRVELAKHAARLHPNRGLFAMVRGQDALSLGAGATQLQEILEDVERILRAEPSLEHEDEDLRRFGPLADACICRHCLYELREALIMRLTRTGGAKKRRRTKKSGRADGTRAQRPKAPKPQEQLDLPF